MIELKVGQEWVDGRGFVRKIVYVDSVEIQYDLHTIKHYWRYQDAKLWLNANSKLKNKTIDLCHLEGL